MYCRIKQQRGLQIRFSASFNNVDLVCSDLEFFLLQLQLDDYLFEAMLGAREILNNAVQHGSNLDETKEVDFFIRLDKNILEMVVVDQGIGFNQDNESSGQDISKDSGRGLSILQHYFDDVSYNYQGNEVQLKRDLGVFVPITTEIHMNEIIIEDNKATIKIQGDIVSSVVNALKAELRNTLENEITDLILDLSQVTFVDSMGIGLLVATHNSLKKKNSVLGLMNVSEDIRKLLNMMRLDQHFNIT